jgi:NADP-dependent 3-hydroxy acid dehydrogenase YdfG
MAKRFEGKTVVVTGGNSGIGLATAKLFKDEGANVAISGRDQKTLDEAVRIIGKDTLAVKADVSKLADLDRLFSQSPPSSERSMHCLPTLALRNSPLWPTAPSKCLTRLSTSM